MAPTTQVEIKRIAEWAGDHRRPATRPRWTGRRPTTRGGRSAVGSDECPGADRCPLGDPCFAEQARRRAAAADVIVVNTHLYGLDVASGGAILPEHDVVVFDEAHVARRRDERHRRRRDRAGTVHRRSPAWCGGSSTTPQLIGSIAEIAESLRDAIGRIARATPADPPARPGARRARPMPGSGSARRREVLVRHLDRRRGRQAAQAAGPDADRPGDRATRPRDRGPGGLRGVRLGLAGFSPARDSRRSTSGRRWPRECGRSARPSSPVRRSRHRWPHGSDARRTSSTWPTSAARSTTRRTRCSTARCTCRTRTATAFRPAVHDELEALITAAGGRTLALFTSWRSMDEAAEALRAPGPLPDPHPARPAQTGARQGVRRQRRDRVCSPRPASSRASTSRAARCRSS